ncbi:hypothetical protein GFL51_05535 [Rhizobium leguminosarum bv. viciae]|nr:hypothetical protein [Rhizobium leguminosarum bv. viciae]
MKYISAPSAGIAVEGVMPVVMATGDVALLRKRPWPEHFRVPGGKRFIFWFCAISGARPLRTLLDALQPIGAQ